MTTNNTTKLRHRIKNYVEDIIKDIRYFTDTEKLDIDDISPMRYPNGEEDRRKNFVNPFAKYNNHNSRIKYRGKK